MLAVPRHTDLLYPETASDNSILLQIHLPKHLQPTPSQCTSQACAHGLQNGNREDPQTRRSADLLDSLLQVEIFPSGPSSSLAHKYMLFYGSPKSSWLIHIKEVSPSTKSKISIQKFELEITRTFKESISIFGLPHYLCKSLDMHASGARDVGHPKLRQLGLGFNDSLCWSVCLLRIDLLCLLRGQRDISSNPGVFR